MTERDCRKLLSCSGDKARGRFRSAARSAIFRRRCKAGSFPGVATDCKGNCARRHIPDFRRDPSVRHRARHPPNVQQEVDPGPFWLHPLLALRAELAEPENLLDPSARRFLQPTPFGAGGPALQGRQAFPHPVRGRPSVAVDGGLLPAFPTEHQTASNSLRPQRGEIRFVAAARVRKRRLRYPLARRRSRVHHAQQLSLIRRPSANRRGNDRLVLPVHNNVHVLAQLEPVADGIHDPARGNREVALRSRIGLPKGTLVRLAAPGVRLAAPGVANLRRLPAPLRFPWPLLRIQPRLRRLDCSQPRLASLQHHGKLVPANRLPEPRVFFRVNRSRPRKQCLDLRAQPGLLMLQSVITHRLALARIRPQLRAVDGLLPEVLKPHLTGDIREVPPWELSTLRMLREASRSEDTERSIIPQRAGNPPRREHSRRIGVNQDPHHCPELIGRVSPPVALLPRPNRAQVQRVFTVADVIRQMPFGKPFPRGPAKAEALGSANTDRASCPSKNLAHSQRNGTENQ